MTTTTWQRNLTEPITHHHRSLQFKPHTTPQLIDRSPPRSPPPPSGQHSTAHHSPPQPVALSSQESFYTSHSSEPLQTTMPTPHFLPRASFAPKMLCRGASLRVFAATSTARRPLPNSPLWTRCRRSQETIGPSPLSFSLSLSLSLSHVPSVSCVCVCACVLPCTTPLLACLQLAY